MKISENQGGTPEGEAVSGESTASERDWTKGNIFLNLVSLSWPMVLNQGLWVIGMFVDMVWVGRLGVVSIAGVGVAGMLVTVLMSATMGLSTGARAIVARAPVLSLIEELTRKISFREGFGDILASGTRAAAETLGEEAKELTAQYIFAATSENKDYDPRLILTTALLLATEPRKPITQLHGISGNTLISWTSWARGLEDAFFSTDDLRTVADRFWGGTKTVDFSTYEGKALAAKKVQDRSCLQESLVLCDVHWPMYITSVDNPAGHVGDPTLESRIYSSITGKETGEEELYRTGERIFNLQRAILLRQGWGGRRGDRILDYFFTHPLKEGEVFFNPEAIMPGPDGKIISRLGTVLDRSEFEGMKSEYYRLRGWDIETGFPTVTGLSTLGLDDITGDLQIQGLVV